jgi:hypothetical protein
MSTNPGLIGQLAREHYRQMLAGASQRQLRSRRRRPVAKNPSAAVRIIRRLASDRQSRRRGRGGPGRCLANRAAPGRRTSTRVNPLYAAVAARICRPRPLTPVLSTIAAEPGSRCDVVSNHYGATGAWARC